MMEIAAFILIRNAYQKYIPKIHSPKEWEQGTNECVVTPHTFMFRFWALGNLWERIGMNGNGLAKGDTNGIYKANAKLNRIGANG